MRIGQELDAEAKKPEDSEVLPGRVKLVIREAAPSVEPQKDVERNLVP